MTVFALTVYVVWFIQVTNVLTLSFSDISLHVVDVCEKCNHRVELEKVIYVTVYRLICQI